MFIKKKYLSDDSVLFSPYLLLLFTYLCWSGNSVFARGVADSLPPMNLSFWRWVVALIVIAPLGLLSAYNQRHLYIKQLKLIITLSLFGIVGFNSLIYHSVQYTTVIQVAIITAFVPAGSVIASWLFYRERINFFTIIGMIVAFFGLVLVIFRGNLIDILDFKFTSGEALAFLAVVSWSIYSVNLRRIDSSINQKGLLFVMISIGLCLIVPLYALEVIVFKEVGVASYINIMGIVYLGVFASVVAFILFNRSVSKIGANRANMFNYFMPIFTSALGYFILGEAIKWFHLIAIIFIFLGVYLTQLKTQKSNLRFDN